VGFTVSTPTLEESDSEGLHQFFPERDFVPLLEVLATVNRHTRWMEEFQHWQQRHHHGRPEARVVYACEYRRSRPCIPIGIRPPVPI